MKTFAALLALLFITTSCADFMPVHSTVSITNKYFEHNGAPNYWSQGDLMFFGRTKHANISLFIPPKIESNNVQVEVIVYNRSKKPINISSENLSIKISTNSGGSLKVSAFSPEEINRAQRVEEVPINSKDIIDVLRNHDESVEDEIRYTRDDRLFSSDPFLETLWLRKSTVFPGQSIRGIVQFDKLIASRSSLNWEFEFEEGNSKVAFPVKIVDREN